ncbi:MAG TPA: MFS transporter [Candidatus Eisenbacteria bacterium]|jgi:MFS family permease
MTDRRLLYASAFLRALATGMVGVIAGLYLARLGLSPAASGLVIGGGLAGAALATLIATLRADHIGRRRFLMALAIVGATGGAVVALGSTVMVIAVAAFVGMLNGMGRDRGAALVIEQAILPTTVPDAERTRAFAWYNVLQDAGHAFGSLLAGAPALLRAGFGLSEIQALRLALLFAALITLAAAALYPRLSPAVEAADGARRVRLSPESRRTITRISALFTLDSLGGGFLTAALVSFFFFRRFGVDEAVLGPLFFLARVLNALSHLGAAWLARRIGLVNTMVFTHIPSSVLLASVAIAPSFVVAALLFLLREGLVEMDVPTRQSYVMAVVRPEERTAASGITHLVRMAAWAVGPPFAGLMMQGLSLASPLVIAAGMKIGYDVLLYTAFRKQKPPEER